MIDIHTHVLYGVDDGAPDQATSLALLQMAAQKGTTDLICTPHVLEAGKGLQWETITAKTRELQELATRNGLKLKLYPGAELEFNWDLRDLLRKGSRDYCLAGSRYVLIELPAATVPNHMSDFLYDLEVKGFVPVIAHAERHQVLMHQPERLLRWLKNGALIQSNAGSFTGLFGAQVQQYARLLLQNKVISFMGSDAHRVEKRNTDLTAAARELGQLAGADLAEQITTNNAECILHDEVFYPPLPEQLVMDANQRQSLWSKLFG